MDSRQEAEERFEWILHPVSVADFEEKYFEQQPLVIAREDRSYYKGLYDLAAVEYVITTSSPDDERISDEPALREFDVTRYVDGVRSTLNEGDVALSSDQVWDHFRQGCSIRLLRPQKHSDRLWRLCSSLEQAWGTGAGANVYLTKKGTQGFAPHWDDVDVFILQIEGSKVWNLHERPSDPDLNVKLASVSSGNLDIESIGAPTQTVTLQQGDLLYLPRGTIHQAKANDDDSLHITISTAFRNTIADVMRVALTAAVDEMVAALPSIRASVPRDYMSFLGVVHQDTGDDTRTEKRAQFMSIMEPFLAKLHEYVSLDAAADQHAKTFLKTQLPPTNASKPSMDTVEDVTSSSYIRLMRADMARLCIEDGAGVLYHTLSNDRAVHLNDAHSIDFDLEYCPALEQILLSYPSAVRVGDLEELDEELQLDLARDLIEAGVCVVHRA